MLGFRPNFYWRFCWKFITPGLMTVILIYTLINLEPLKDGDRDYPPVAHIIGMCISALGLVQLPAFAIYAICTQKKDTLWEVKNCQQQNFMNVYKNISFTENQKCIPPNCKMVNDSKT